MSIAHTDVLREICADVESVDGDEVVHRRWGRLSTPKRRAGQTHQTSLQAWLAELIYLEYHVRAVDLTAALLDGGADARNIPDWEDVELAEQVIAADGGRHRWEPGWQILGRTVDEVRVQGAGVSLLVSHPDVRLDDASTGECSVRMPILRRYPQAGWIATGGRVGHLDPRRTILRVYLAATEASVADVVGDICRTLDSLSLRYSLKTGNNAVMFTRADALVVYLDEAEAHEHWHEIWSLLRHVGPALRDETPGFAEPVTAGVAIGREPAEDGSGRTSLGLHRSHLVASGLLAAPRASATSPERLYEAVCAAFLQAGVSPEHPAWDQRRGRPRMLDDEVHPCE